MKPNHQNIMQKIKFTQSHYRKMKLIIKNKKPLIKKLVLISRAKKKKNYLKYRKIPKIKNQKEKKWINPNKA